MRYPKFIVRLGDSLAKLISDIKAGLRFYDKHKENKITIDHVPPKNPEYRDIWIDTSHEYIPPTQYFTVFIIQGPHQTIKISDGIGEYVSNTKLEAKTPVSVKVIPDEGYDASKTNLTHFVLSEDTVVEALTEPTKTMLRVDIRQVPHQTITAHYNGQDYTEPFMAEYGSTITFTVTPDKNYYEGTLNYDRIDKLTESVIIRSVELPRVQSYIVRIVQSEHQRISVEYNGKTYYETFEIPVNVAHNYAVYIDADNGWNAGEIKEVKDKNKHGSTISASPASPIMKTITVEQYQNQNIWVYVTEPDGTVELYKERFSITVPMNSHITTKVVAKNENWTPGVANIQEADVTDNIIISATEATGSDEVHYSVNVLFDMADPQDLHGTLKLITGGRTINITHSDVIRLEENAEVKFELEIDNGYKNTTVLSEYVLNKDITVRINPSTIKIYKVQLQQSEGQTIYAMFNGQRYTDSFEADFGSRIAFGIESTNTEDWIPGTLSVTSINSLENNTTITATRATRIMRYNLTVDFASPDSHTRLKVTKDGTVLGTYTNDFTLTRELHDTRFEFELSLDEGYRNDSVLNPIVLNKDTRIEIKPTRFKQFLVTPVQTEGQTIYIVNKATGERYTEPTYVDYGTTVEFILGKRNDETGHYEVGTINYPAGYNNGIVVRGDITVTATPAKRYGVVNITVPAVTSGVEDAYLPNASYTVSYQGLTTPITFTNGNGKGSTKTSVAPYGTNVTVRETSTPTGYNAIKDVTFTVGDTNNITVPNPSPKTYLFTAHNLEDHYTRIIATSVSGTKYENGDRIPYGTKVSFKAVPFDNNYTIVNNTFAGINLYHSNKQNKIFVMPDAVKYISGDETINFFTADRFVYVTNDIDTALFDGNGNVPVTEVKLINITFEDPSKAWVESMDQVGPFVQYIQYPSINKNGTIWVYNIPGTTIRITPAFASDIVAPTYTIDSLDSATYSKPVTVDTINIPVPKRPGLDINIRSSKFQPITAVYDGNRYTTSFRAQKNTTVTLEAPVDTELFTGKLVFEKLVTPGSRIKDEIINNKVNVTTAGDIISEPVFLWETTGEFRDRLSLVDNRIKEADKKKIDKIFNTGLVKNANNAFRAIEGDSFDGSTFGPAMSSVTSLFLTFDNSTLKQINVSNWDTSNVTNMSNTFSHCNLLNSLDVSKWDTSKVTNMEGMFFDCNLLASVDVSKWNTSKVTDMASMFSGCGALQSIDVSKWNTNNVTDMSSIFFGCRSLTSLNISNWDTSKATNMTRLFFNCNSLTTITGVLDFKNCAEYYGVFYGCNNLTSVKVKNLPVDIDTFCNEAIIDKSKVVVVS